MPELPESDMMRRVIERDCLNRTVESVDLGDDTRSVDLPSDNARERLIGRQFTETRRHGKYIFAGSKTGPWMVVHLGMTGKLIAFDTPEPAPGYTKLLISFEGNRRLAFRCPRKLGSVEIIDEPDAYVAEKKLGPDALEISDETFRDVIGSSRGAVKSALISQHKLAGIGNVWSDEILYRVGVHPKKTGADLSDETLDTAFDAMRDILHTVLDNKADYAKLPDDWLVRHRKTDVECPKCDGTIATTKVGGRTAYFCEKHQKPSD